MLNTSPPTPFTYPPKVRPGDKVAVLSPSSGLPGIFPHAYEQGLQRLQDLFQLEPIEYPTTRKMNSSPQDRARDLHAAFANPEIKAIISTIGGDDQIKVLRYLDSVRLKAQCKAFFGYSDNTNLHNYLWNLGVVSYHGASIMVQFGRSGTMHPTTLQSLKHALFEQGEFEIRPASEFTDEDLSWDDPANLSRQPDLVPAADWVWQNAETIVEGTLWGGNLEILSWNMQANKYIQPLGAYTGKIFYFETSEELPSATEVYRTLMCMGERGLLQQFAAVLVGRAKATSIEHPQTAEEKAIFVYDQAEAIRRAIGEYHPHVPVVFNLDIGHTDPQYILPHGGMVKIDGVQRKIFLRY